MESPLKANKFTHSNRSDPMKTLAPKSLYYLGLSISLIGPISYPFIFMKVFEAGAPKDFLFALAIFGGVCVFWLFIYVNRAIFMFKDEVGNISFGTVFFEKKVKANEIEGFGKVLFYRNLYWVRMSGKLYFFVSLDPAIKSIRN